MQSRTMGVAIALMAAAAVVVLFVVLRDDGGEAPAPPAPPAAEDPASEAAPAEPDAAPDPPERDVPTIVLRDGEPVGGAQELTFRRGERIEFVVRSETAAEIHLHGYDVVRDVDAGGRARFDVDAELEGSFEVELHPEHVVIAEIAVHP